MSTPKTRADEMARFYSVFVPNQEMPVGWTGSTATCTAGATSPEARAATESQVSYFRDFYGLAKVTLDPALDAIGQQSALMMEAKNDLSHNPGSDWPCYTSTGATGAARANLSLGVSGAAAITGYMFDPGTSNTQVGHRRWVLNPKTVKMGSGSTGRANALIVFGDASQLDPAAVVPEWLPYPAAGYFPDPLQPNGRWSLSASDSTTDFSAATVTMTGPSGAVPVTQIPVSNGYGPNTLVWEAAGLVDAQVGADVTYHVTVSGVTRGSPAVSLPAYSYSVTLFEPDRPLTSTTLPTVSGTPQVGQTLTATAGSFTPAATGMTYQWLRSGTSIPGATGLSYRVTSADVGATLSVQVTGTRRYYVSTTARSAETTPVPAPPTPSPMASPTRTPIVPPTPSATAKPTSLPAPLAMTVATAPGLTGRAVVGRSLKLRSGTTIPSATRTTIMWLRNGTPIRGATGPTYRLSRSDRGRKLSVQVIYQRAGYSPLVVRTSATKRVR